MEETPALVLRGTSKFEDNKHFLKEDGLKKMKPFRGIG